MVQKPNSDSTQGGRYLSSSDTPNPVSYSDPYPPTSVSDGLSTAQKAAGGWNRGGQTHASSNIPKPANYSSPYTADAPSTADTSSQSPVPP